MLVKMLPTVLLYQINQEITRQLYKSLFIWEPSLRLTLATDREPSMYTTYVLWL